MSTRTCDYEWPVDDRDADLIPTYARPRHRCDRPADHIEHVYEVRLDEHGHHLAEPVPHRCHCAAWTPAEVRA